MSFDLKNRPKAKYPTNSITEKWARGFEKKMRIKYAEFCETRIHDIKADAIATFIEDEIFGQEPSEILGVSPERGKA